MLTAHTPTHYLGARGPDSGGGRPRRRRGVGAGLVAVLALMVMAFAAPTASAAPFSCDAFGYLFQTPTLGTNNVQQIDLATGENTVIGQTPDQVNGVGYNVVDDYFYAWDYDISQVVRINDDLSLTPLGVPTGPGGTVDASHGYNIGDIDASGHYWMAGADDWYEIDLTTPTPTVLRAGTITYTPGFNFGADWAWIRGSLYFTAADATTNEAHLMRFNPATGTFSDVFPGGLGYSVINPATGNTDLAGAVYADASGYLYASYNGTGQIWRIDPVTGQGLLVAPNGPPSGLNDGARCAEAPIPTITVTKTVDGRVRPADQFTVGLVKPDGTTGDSKTTSGTQTTVSTTNFPASQGKTYGITDAMASGSPTPLGEYIKSIECKDSDGNTVPTGGSAPNWTLDVANATAYTCNVTNRARADLKLEKSATPTPAVPGTNETYSLKVTNSGPSTATNVRVSDPLPAGLSFVSAGSGCTEANKTVTCTAAEIAPGASRTFTVTARIASSVDSCDQLRNTASVTSSVPDPNTSNNSATICPPIEGRSGLSITKGASTATVPAGGGQVMYTLVVRNRGPSDARDVKVTDALAPGLTLVSATPSQGSCSTASNAVSCDMGTLRDGGSAQVLVTVNTHGAPGCITNVARVAGSQRDPNPEDNQASVEVCVPPPPTQPPARFDLEVDKRANHDAVAIGERLTYTIVVTNKGPDAAPDAKVTDTFNRPATLVSVKTTQGSCTNQIPITCQLGTVPAGGKVTITVVIELREVGGGQRNAASATGTGTDTDPSDNLDGTAVRGLVKLRVTKVASRSAVRAGESLSYRIRVRNASRSGVARNVRVCDRLASGLVFVSSRPRAKLSRGQRCWTIKRLRAGKSKTYRVTARALRGASGRKTNTATATSPDARRARAKRPVRVLPGGVLPDRVTG
jgi:uncharacterized repeat protein (TIGR01451 family)